MKKKKKTIALSLIFIFVLISNAFSQIDKLTLEIKFSKNKFMLSENIYVNVYLINLSNDTVITNTLSMDHSFLKFILTDAKERKFEDTYPRFDGSPMGLKLTPYSSETWIWNVNARYGIDGRYKHLPTKHCLPVGKYSIFAEFNSGYGLLKSNRLEFEIIEPQNEEREAYKLLSHSDDLILEKQDDDALNVLDSLKQKHLKSVYRPTAFQQQLFILNYILKDERKAYEVARSLIDAYPNSEYAMMALSEILTHLGAPEKDKKIRREILEYVSSKYSGTKVAEFGIKTLKGDKARE